ncbi:MAG: Mov34/MPN/PAD-1 family protein [Candidatus Methylomirabilia bacterium]
MSAAALRMAGDKLAAVFEHCRRELPHEACGILGGRAGRVESVHPVQNAYPSPSRFVMEPTGQFRVMDELSRAGQELVGIYHSHPGGLAAPSNIDLKEACWPGTTLPNYPGAIQVIVSLRDRDAPVANGYAVVQGLFVEVPLIVEELGNVRSRKAEEPMPVTVRIPTPLQRLAGGRSEVSCSATSIAGLLEVLEIGYPGIKERLTEDGKVRRFINIYVNGEDIRTLGAEATALKEGDTVAIIAAIAGGR